jgi:hypothetical protein
MGLKTTPVIVSEARKPDECNLWVLLLRAEDAFSPS